MAPDDSNRGTKNTDKETENQTMETETELSPAEYEQLIAQYEDTLKNLQEGQIIRGRVMQVTPSEVIVDIGYKSEGLISISEFTDYEGRVTVSAGDRIDVLLESTEDQNGYVVLSKDKAEKMKVWDDVEKAYREGTTVKGRIIDRIKGGLAVDIGVKAFLPGSLVDTKPVKNLEGLRGREFDFKVISVDKKRGNIVLSRKAVIEVELEAKKKETLSLLEEGRVLRGVVKNLTDYGAFVDLGGLDGLLHVTDISWGRINHPSDVLKVGDEIDVVVLKFDRETERVSLGTKQLTADPWEKVPDRYPVGSRVTGRVTNVTDYGAFVELEQGIEGLIHVSEMSWSKKMKNPSKVVSVGDQVEAVISDVNTDTRRISLSLKDTQPDPWEGILERYPVGTEISGKVRNLTDFGAFVEIEEGVDGLIHVSDMSWTKRIKHPSEVLKKGEDVRATVTHIDPENRRISLSIKEFLPNEWEEFKSRHQVGSVVEGTVSRIADFGVFVNIDGMVEGLMHVSETPLERGQKPQDFYEEGQHIRAAILRIEDEDMKIGLSSRDIDQEAVGQVQVAEPAEEAPAPPSAIEAARAPQFREAVAPPAPVEISDVEPEAEAVPQAEAIPSAEPAPEPPAAARIAKPARTKAAKPAATKAAKPPAKKKAAATTKKKAKSSGSAKSKSK